MIRFFQQLGCHVGIPLIPTDILTNEGHPLFVDSRPNTKTDSFRVLSSKMVDDGANIGLYEGTRHPESDLVIQTLSSNSQAVGQGSGAMSQNVHHANTSVNPRAMITAEKNANKCTEHIDPVPYPDYPTSRVAKQADFQDPPPNTDTVKQGIGATFQDAHHFSISGNARIVNIGQQNVHNRNTNCLDNLEKFVSFNALHDSSAQDPERCCHPDTRLNVLQQMHTWLDDANALEPILWLHGPAGVGKSAIAQTIAYSYGRDKVGATFFFFRSDPNRNDGNRLFPTLAWRLASSIPIVKGLIACSLEEDPDIPRKTIEAQFEQLIAQPFLSLSCGSMVPTSSRVIIVDGLDECSDVKHQRRILKIIGSAVADARFPLRFIISCRPEAHIEDFFAQFKHPILQIDLANVDGAYRDIKTYLTSEFARIAIEQGLDPKKWPGRDVVDALVSNSSGQFVYVSTVIKYVGDEYESAVARLNIILGLKSSLGQPPFSDLDSLYMEILQRQRDKNFLKGFFAVLIARSAISGESLHKDDAILLGLDEQELRRKLRGLHSLLKFEPFIRVHHKSFLDFLDDPLRSGEYHVSKYSANRRYMELITNLLVKAAHKAMEQPDCHGVDHFTPRFAFVTKCFPLEIRLSLDDLEEILRPLLVIQENLLQIPNMSLPWEPRACEQCWTFYMINDLLLHLACFRGEVQSQEPVYVGIRPLTAMEERGNIPELDSDACLSLLFANLRSKKSQLSLNVDTIGLVRALVRFDPVEIAMKVQSITDAENLIEFLFCLNRNQCFESWFGAAYRNATRLAVAIYGRIPLLPRSLFLNGPDLSRSESAYQGKAVKFSSISNVIQHEFLDAFVWGNICHGNMTQLLGMCPTQMSCGTISPSPENGRLDEWRRSTSPTMSKIQHIVFEVANAIQYLHSLDIVISFEFTTFDVYLDSNNHAKVDFFIFRPNHMSSMLLEYCGYDDFYTLEVNVNSFGLLFYEVLFNERVNEPPKTRPKEPEIPENVWQLIQWCCTENPKQRPTMDRVVQEMECWASLG